MHKSLLVRKASVAEWEAEHLIDGIPFGYCNPQWLALLAQKEPDDELWFWSTDEESWRRMMGLAGMALVRGGQVIDSFFTGMN